MSRFRIVFDTNVLRAAMWSSRGASFHVLGTLPHADVCPLLSLPLYLEYQEVLTRAENLPVGVTAEQMLRFLRRFAAQCQHRDIYFLWRPWLRDRDDDMVLELAVAGRATHIVTFNIQDFRGIEKEFGIKAVTPGNFVRQWRSNP